MKQIYITENQLIKLTETENKEITFFEFFINVKKYLKDLLTKPSKAEPNSILLKKVNKGELLDKMEELGIIKKNEKVDEVFVDEENKKIAKYFVSYKIPKKNFEEKVKLLYNDIIQESIKSVFSDEQKLVDEIKSLDFDKAYEIRGGLNEEGEGGVAIAGGTSCGSVMQGGGGNPDAGQYVAPFGKIQKRGFYSDSLKRNKDSKNKSVSINKK